MLYKCKLLLLCMNNINYNNNNNNNNNHVLFFMHVFVTLSILQSQFTKNFEHSVVLPLFLFSLD